jgi:N-acetylneuraminic acid mutarotase
MATVLLGASAAQAHFLFLAPQTTPDGKTTVQVYFSEDASPDDPELLQRITDLKAWQVSADSPPRELQAVCTKAELRLEPQGDPAGALFIAIDDFGVLSRGGKSFRLRYYAKTGPAAGHIAWESIDTAQHLALDVSTRWEGNRVKATVRFRGQPVAGAQVVARGPEYDLEATTDAQGEVRFEIPKAGICSLRARHIEQAEGDLNGQSFAETRHYSTVACEVPPSAVASGDAHLTALPVPVTSFGGAVLDGALYLYGGHSGSAHSYSREEQGDTLMRLSLSGQGGWTPLSRGPALQGLALVAHGGKLYRLGGFTAQNAEGEKHDLWSQDSVACYDPHLNQWQELPPLPEPRSSFDAAVLGEAIYVVGGWQLRGEEESVWHPTAWKLELSRDKRRWEPLPSPPFRRRALAVAASQGKLYVIGGMQQEGGPTRRVDVFDPQTGAWTQGPDILGEQPLAGFGAAACELGDRLYVSTSEGKLQRLSTDGTAWELVRDLPTGRFFHRMLPAGENRLVIVGGANMGSGKFAPVELLTVPPTP